MNIDLKTDCIPGMTQYRSEMRAEYVIERIIIDVRLK